MILFRLYFPGLVKCLLSPHNSDIHVTFEALVSSYVIFPYKTNFTKQSTNNCMSLLVISWWLRVKETYSWHCTFSNTVSSKLSSIPQSRNWLLRYWYLCSWNSTHYRIQCSFFPRAFLSLLPPKVNLIGIFRSTLPCLKTDINAP